MNQSQEKLSQNLTDSKHKISVSMSERRSALILDRLSERGIRVLRTTCGVHRATNLDPADVELNSRVLTHGPSYALCHRVTSANSLPIVDACTAIVDGVTRGSSGELGGPLDVRRRWCERRRSPARRAPQPTASSLAILPLGPRDAPTHGPQ